MASKTRISVIALSLLLSALFFLIPGSAANVPTISKTELVPPALNVKAPSMPEAEASPKEAPISGNGTPRAKTEDSPPTVYHALLTHSTFYSDNARSASGLSGSTCVTTFFVPNPSQVPSRDCAATQQDTTHNTDISLVDPIWISGYSHDIAIQFVILGAMTLYSIVFYLIYQNTGYFHGIKRMGSFIVSLVFSVAACLIFFFEICYDATIDPTSNFYWPTNTTEQTNPPDNYTDTAQSTHSDSILFYLSLFSIPIISLGLPLGLPLSSIFPYCFGYMFILFVHHTHSWAHIPTVGGDVYQFFLLSCLAIEWAYTMSHSAVISFSFAASQVMAISNTCAVLFYTVIYDIRRTLMSFKWITLVNIAVNTVLICSYVYYMTLCHGAKVFYQRQLLSILLGRLADDQNRDSDMEELLLDDDPSSQHTDDEKQLTPLPLNRAESFDKSTARRVGSVFSFMNSRSCPDILQLTTVDDSQLASSAGIQRSLTPSLPLHSSHGKQFRRHKSQTRLSSPRKLGDQEGCPKMGGIFYARRQVVDEDLEPPQSPNGVKFNVDSRDGSDDSVESEKDGHTTELVLSHEGEVDVLDPRKGKVHRQTSQVCASVSKSPVGLKDNYEKFFAYYLSPLLCRAFGRISHVFSLHLTYPLRSNGATRLHRDITSSNPHQDPIPDLSLPVFDFLSYTDKDIDEAYQIPEVTLRQKMEMIGTWRTYLKEEDVEDDGRRRHSEQVTDSEGIILADEWCLIEEVLLELVNLADWTLIVKT